MTKPLPWERILTLSDTTFYTASERISFDFTVAASKKSINVKTVTGKHINIPYSQFSKAWDLLAAGKPVTNCHIRGVAYVTVILNDERIKS